MLRTLKAELIKLRTTRTFFGLLAGAAAFIILNCVAINFALDRFANNGGQSFQGFSIAENATPFVIGLAGNTILFTMSLGVLTMAGEYKHSTADGTFLAVPNRMHVLLGKMGAAFITGVVIALAATLVAVAIGGWVVSRHGYDVVFDGSFFTTFAANLYIVGGMSAVGVAAGALIRHQVGALIGTLAWLFIGESIIGVASQAANKFTFNGLLNATLGGNSFGQDLLPRGLAAAMFLGYVIILAGAATARLRASDVA